MESKYVRKTRTNDPRHFILNQTPGIEHIEIAGARLPTQEQVLLSYMARMDQQPEGKKCQRTVINAIIDNIAKLCEISNNQINVKGKTTEKLGVIGKEKAIACEVIASIIKYD